LKQKKGLEYKEESRKEGRLGARKEERGKRGGKGKQYRCSCLYKM
jgi:hypothetical protein